MDLFNKPLSVSVVNGMTVTVYPQLTLIERDGHWERYIGYTKAEALKMFRRKYPLRSLRKLGALLLLAVSFASCTRPEIISIRPDSERNLYSVIFVEHGDTFGLDFLTASEFLQYFRVLPYEVTTTEDRLFFNCVDSLGGHTDTNCQDCAISTGQDWRNDQDGEFFHCIDSLLEIGWSHAAAVHIASVECNYILPDSLYHAYMND